jgi:hypothetical protein
MGGGFAEVVAARPFGCSAVCPSLPDGAASVGSPGELVALLRRVAAECPRPLIVTVVRADGDQLSVGLGRPVSFLTYIPAHDDPPYFSVVGVEADGEVCFDYAGEPTFYAARNTVPFEVALDVACRFAASGGLPLPDVVAWEDV